jgi:hypothetical protein
MPDKNVATNFIGVLLAIKIAQQDGQQKCYLESDLLERRCSEVIV